MKNQITKETLIKIVAASKTMERDELVGLVEVLATFVEQYATLLDRTCEGLDNALEVKA